MPIEFITDNSWLLSLATFAPLIGVLFLALAPRDDERLIKLIGIATAAVTFALGLAVLAAFDFGKAGALQFHANHTWIDFLRSNYNIGLDGISLPLFVLSSFITLCVMIYTWENIPRPATRRRSSR